jgi:CHASE2 domain
MTTPQPKPASEYESLWRHFAVTWITSIAVALIVLGITWSLERIGLIKGMETGGEDAAMRLFAGRPHEAKHPVVVVWIDNQTKRIWEEAKSTVGVRLPDLVHLVAQGATAVVLDVELAAGVSDGAKKRLAEEFAKTSARIVAPLQELRLTHSGNEWGAEPDWIDASAVGNRGNVVRAAALLSSDERDGVVRHLTSGVCLFLKTSKGGSAGDGRWVHIPSLAEAAVDRPQEAAPCDPEEAEDEPPIILFQKENLDKGAIRTLSASELIDKNGNPVTPLKPLPVGAFVVIGQTDAEASADLHRTPLGVMPGALVTAHSIFTVAQGEQGSIDKLLYDIVLIAFLGGVFACISAGIEYLCPQSDKCKEATDGYLEWPRFALEIGGLAIYFVIAGSVVIFVWTFMASRALAAGLVFGTFVPLLGVALETLMEVGEVLIQFVRQAAKWCVDRLFEIGASGGAAAAVLVVLLGSGHAEENASWLTFQDLKADVTIVRGKESLRLEGLKWELRPFDTVRVGAGTDVQVHLPGRDLEVLHGPDVLYVGPPLRTGLRAQLWDTFWGRPLGRGETYAPGITVVQRGDHEGPLTDTSAAIGAGGDMARALPVAGPLRLPSTFPNAGYLMTDVSGLALAWSGGTPPYDVMAEDGGGATIAEFRSETTFLWRPDWRPPQAAARLRISDANDRALRIDIKPSTSRPPVPGADPLADAIDLFETEPAWRLEALRRIARLADRDPTAAQAVLTIRLTE